MMDCRQCDELLVAHLDNELSEAEKASVEAHIESCAACQSRLAEYRLVQAALGQWTEVTPSTSLDDQTLTRVRREAAQSEARNEDAELLDKMRWWWLLPIVLASIFGVGFFLTNPLFRSQLGLLLEGRLSSLLAMGLSIVGMTVVVVAIVLAVVSVARKMGRPS